jgi:hypothetical protein
MLGTFLGRCSLLTVNMAGKCFQRKHINYCARWPRGTCWWLTANHTLSSYSGIGIIITEYNRVGRITVTARSKIWTVFARSNTGVVCSNPTRGTDVWVHLFCVCVVLCVGRGLATGWSPMQGALRTVWRIKTEKAAKVQQKDCRDTDR